MSYKFRRSRVDLVFGESAQRRCELVDIDVWPHKTFNVNAVILFRPSDCPEPDSYHYTTDYSQRIARFEAFAAEG